MRGRTLLRLSLAMACWLGTSESALAQVQDESRLLREAAARESRGDFDGAEDVLLRLLEANPLSTGGLFALERVLRAKGSTAELLPAVDAFLERDPGSSGVRYLKLRVLVEVDSLDALETEAEAWFRLDPGSVVPYREVSRVYQRAFGADRALEVLREGRRALGDEHALAMEMGDLLAADDPDAAVREWGRAVGADGAQSNAVARRISELEEDVEEAARDVVRSLGDSDLFPRRRAGAEIALSVGLEDEALELAQAVVAELEGRARASFLTDVARRAREGDLPAVAAWAYRELGSNANTAAERRQFDLRMVEVSLAAGDTLAALEAQQRLVSSYTPGSADRRRAMAEAIRMESGIAGPERLHELLEAFREAFPQAPELDAMAATVAAGLLGRGDPEGAAAVLEGIDGPRSAMERAYLLLDAGDVEQGRHALLMAVTGLPPATATEIIQFAGLLGRLSPEGAAALAAAGVLAHRGAGAQAATAVAEQVEALPETEAPSLLAEAARMAERGGAGQQAADLRRRLLEAYPQAPEVGEASLALALYTARRPGGREGAIRILESLIAARPNAAVVPAARRELERLRGGEER